MRDWLVPALLGLATAAALWAAQPGGDGGGDGGHAGEGDGGPPPAESLLFPFPRSMGRPGDSTTFLALAPEGKARALAHLDASAPPGEAAALAWQGDRVALLTLPNLQPCPPSPEAGPSPCAPPGTDASDAADWPQALAPAPGDGGPRLLQGGHNATRVTAYVFDEAGLLLASNADDTGRFRLHGDFVRLPATAWYLGANQTAPDGTAHLPGPARPLLERARPLLDGLPEGGVATLRSNAFVSTVGTLFLTVRVDELVLAP